MINPSRVSLKCRRGHQYLYDLDKAGEIQCLHNSCSEIINSSRVFRGTHPHIIWVNDEFQTSSNYVATFTTIPLTSKSTFEGLPTVYPINPTTKNSLSKKSFALVHQIVAVDANCFKDKNGHWLQRIGQLARNDKNEIIDRLKFYLGLTSAPNEDWFKRNASPELIRKIYDSLSEDEQQEVLNDLFSNI